MQEFKILLVDDEEKFTEILKKRLSRKNYLVETANSALSALEKMENMEFDAGIFDINMSGMDGLELLIETKKIHPKMLVIMLTGYANVDSAIRSMKNGAFDYLVKPIRPVELDLALEKALESKKIIDPNNKLLETIQKTSGRPEIVGVSQAVLNLKLIIEKVADSPLPVLILGESGTGKELVASSLHYNSCRAHHPFIPINASAIPHQLLESELFGYVKGAFTGALADKKGLLELANEGTLFLDEIGDMDASLQVKLLRFLDTGEIRPVGGSLTKKLNVRVVTATNIDMKEAIEEGNVREDFYYRLSVIKIEVPPLRDRGNDKLYLAEHFLRQSNSNKRFSTEAEEFILNYSFPGNVRELINLVERSILFSKDSKIMPKDFFPGEIKNKTYKKTLSLEDMEKEHIEQILAKTGWNKTEAAKILKIGLRTLYRKISEYDIHN